MSWIHPKQVVAGQAERAALAAANSVFAQQQAVIDAGIPVFGSIWRRHNGGLFVVIGVSMELSSHEVLITFSELNSLLPLPWTWPLSSWHQKVGDVKLFTPVTGEEVQ